MGLKLVDSDNLDATLTAEADAIRNKTGSTESLTFDFSKKTGFATPISQIEAASIPEIVIEDGQVSSYNPVKINLTSAQKEIVENEKNYQFIFDLTVEDLPKLFFAKEFDATEEHSFMLTSRQFNSSNNRVCIYAFSYDKSGENAGILIGSLSAKKYLEFDEIDDNFERTSRKVTSVSSSSTDSHYPSAKAVYDFVTDQLNTIDTALQALL